MRVNDSLRHLGIPRGTFYRWKKQRAWEREQSEPVSPVQAFEALPEEKEAVVQYALDHPEIRHRELSWRMIDDDVAYLSASTVYRILRAESLMHRQRGRTKRYRDEVEKASRPDEIWATDLMYLKVGGVQYYLVTFIDEYSRYLVHWELLTSMDGHSISTAAQRAIETLPTDHDGKLTVTPTLRSDNGSGFISGEFVGLLSHHELTHHRIRPHCPEENGVQERFNRTLREGIEEHDLESRYDFHGSDRRTDFALQRRSTSQLARVSNSGDLVSRQPVERRTCSTPEAVTGSSPTQANQPRNTTTDLTNFNP